MKEQKKSDYTPYDVAKIVTSALRLYADSARTWGVDTPDISAGIDAESDTVLLTMEFDDAPRPYRQVFEISIARIQ